jgi:hypothetical protein
VFLVAFSLSFLLSFLSPFSSLMPFQHCKWKSTHNGCEKCMEWIKIIQRWRKVHFFVHSVKVGEDASGPVFISLCFRSGLNGLVFFFFTMISVGQQKQKMYLGYNICYWLLNKDKDYWFYSLRL